MDECGQFTDSASLFTENFLSVGGTDDDLTEALEFCLIALATSATNLGTSVSDTDFTARETFLGEFTSEEFTEFSLENTVWIAALIFALGLLLYYTPWTILRDLYSVNKCLEFYSTTHLLT